MVDRFSPRDRLYLIVSSLITISIASLALVGWGAEIDLLKSVVSGFPNMKPITAVCFLILGTGFLAASLGPKRSFGLMTARSLGILIALIGLAVLASYAFTLPGLSGTLVLGDTAGWQLAQDHRMSPHGGVSFLLTGLALAAFSSRKAAWLSAPFALAALTVTYAAMLGQLYHADYFYGVNKINSMALHSAFLFAVNSATLIAVNRNCRLVRLISSTSLGGQAVRRLLPVVILVPTFVGWVTVIGQERGFYDTGFGSAMFTLILVAVMAGVVLFYGQAMHASDRKRLIVEADLAEKEMRYRELFDYSQGMICIHDLDGNLLTVNKAGLQLLGYDEHEMTGRSLFDFMPAELRSTFDAYIRQVTHEGIAQGLLELKTKGGKTITVRFQNILATEAGRDPYVLGHAIDVTELVEAQQQLRELSLTDELTGLLNRRGFLTLAEQQLRLERHAGTARGLTLLFGDMDGLKTINDTLGHEAGSEAIVSLAQVLTSVVRSSDLVARWGGDEFVILSVGAAEDNIRLMFERIETAIAEYNDTSGKAYQVACSIGVAPVTLDGNRSFEEMISEADQAMYMEKKRRKAKRANDADTTALQSSDLVPNSLAWY
ncbi:MAG: diguanylate cyclase [Pyrinomonadaceae bacterium]